MSHATVAAAAWPLGVAAETLDGLRDRWIERAMDGTAWEWLGVSGSDEMARTRGHRAGVALVTVPLAGGGVDILAVRADRPKEPVAAFWRAIPAPLRHTLEPACTEMDEGVVRAIAAEGPGAEIVSDRVQGVRASRDGAAPGRTQERQRRQRARPKAAYAALQGAPGPFRKRPGERSRTTGTGASGC